MRRLSRETLSRRRIMTLSAVLACALAAAAALRPEPAVGGDRYPVPQPFVGFLDSVIDGDTFRLHDGKRIRMWGIDAPEHDQTCRGPEDIVWACGVQAEVTLHLLLQEGPIRCQEVTQRAGKPWFYQMSRTIIARCVVETKEGDLDVARQMVAEGMAEDWDTMLERAGAPQTVPRYSARAYRLFQLAAMERRLGIWAGGSTGVMPAWLWRQRTGKKA